MTATTPASMTPVHTGPGCWESFTSALSRAATKVAEFASRAFHWVTNGLKSMCAAIKPAFGRAVAWVQMHQKEALIGGGVAALAAAVGAYFFCCKNDKAADAKADSAKTDPAKTDPAKTSPEKTK